MNRKIISSAENEQEELFDWFYQQLTTTFQDETVRELFLLAFVEAVNNAAKHGNENSPDREIKLDYLLQKELACVSVEDEGLGFKPVFPELKQVTGSRGRGLGFIKANADAVFFNRRGNRITLIKGGKAMKTFGNINATLTFLADGTALITGLQAKGKSKFDLHIGISEIFEFYGKKVEKIYFDLRQVRLLNSLSWGIFFAEAEKKKIKLIHLFNASEAIQTSAKQMGIGNREDVYKKINVSADDKEVQELLGKA